MAETQNSEGNTAKSRDDGDHPPDYNTAVSTPVSKPINTQPRTIASPTGEWMTIPIRSANCPPGLEYLTTIDKLLVKQRVTVFELNNKFKIKNALGQNVYWANDDVDLAGQCCFGNNRPFDVEILDHTNREVIHVTRPLTCWLSEVEVCASDGQLFGLVEKEATFLHPNYLIKNHYGEGVLRIKGPLVQSHLLGNIEFTIKQMDGAEIGKISKKWTGLAQELFTDASHFGISFPLDLDVRMKAVLLGACLLINAMHFERK